MSEINIKTLLDEGNTIVVCDANVYLHIYSFAQGYCDYAVTCLNTVKSYLIVPAMIEIEFSQHYRNCYKNMAKRLSNAEEQCLKPIEALRTAVLATCENLQKMQFPDIDELLFNLEEKIDEQIGIVENYFLEREDTLNLISQNWLEHDYVSEIMADLKTNGQVLEGVSQLDLYRLCETGKKRYKKSTPPGFMDNDKDGIRKYGDFIWWNQIIQYAKKQKKNVILVTDDMKRDWWETIGEQKVLRKELQDEFAKTKQKLYPFVSSDFYGKIATDYGITKPDVVQYALSITHEDYCRRIAETVFYSVEEDLTDNGIDYIDEESAHIGDSGIVELSVKSWKFLGGEQVRREDDDVTYVLKYHIDLEGESYCYSWKESPSGHLIRQEEYFTANHIFSGTVDVKVERKADILLDYENENSFEDAEIIDGSLEETEYLPYDEEENFDGDDVDVEFEVGGVIYTVNKKKDAYSVCSICGRPLSLVNDRGGVCDTCYCEYDI